MSSEPLDVESEPMMADTAEIVHATSDSDGENTLTRSKKHNLAPLNITSINDDLPNIVIDTPASLPSLPSTPCTPVSAIQAQHLTEIEYEQVIDKQRKFRIWAIVMFCLCTILCAVGIVGVVFGVEVTMNPWAIAFGSVFLLMGVAANIGGLVMCFKVSRLGDQATQLASSEVIERCSTHTYTHFAVVPSPMVLRKLVSGSLSKKDGKPSTGTGMNGTKIDIVDDMSTRTYEVSLGDSREKVYSKEENRIHQNHTSPKSASSLSIENHDANV